MTEKTQLKPSEEIDQKRLEMAGAAVADLAHLAKNILQVLSGCSEIIDIALNTGQTDRVRQAWQLHQPCFWRLKKFQLDLIKFTKSYPLNKQPCDLRAVVAAAVKQVEPFLEKRNIRLSVSHLDLLPEVVADGEKLRDTVVNLLVTAFDNLQDEPGQVVLCTSFEPSVASVKISVRDSGPLLDEETLQLLLTPYERCRNMLGTGLELPLTKEVVQAHDGRLIFQSGAKAENEITIFLPLGY